MRALVIPILLLVCCSACAAAAPGARSAEAIDSNEAVIGRTLDDWHNAAANADEARYFSHFASKGVFLGTDGTERWNVQAFRTYAHPHFAAGKAWKFLAQHRRVTFSEGGAVAWFDEDLVTERLGPARGAGVVVREGGAWKISLYDLSIPIPNERFAAVKQAILGKE